MLGVKPMSRLNNRHFRKQIVSLSARQKSNGTLSDGTADTEKRAPTSGIAHRTPCRTHFSHAPTAAQRFDVAFQTLKNTCETETCLGSKSSSTAASVNWVMRQAASGRVKRALSSLARGATCSWRDLVVLVWKTTRVYSARCGVCIEVGPSPSRLSSERQCLTRSCGVWQHLLGFTMSPNFPPFVSLFVASGRGQAASVVETFDGSLSTRYE